MLELYHNESSTSSQKVRLFLTETEIAWESRHLDLWRARTELLVAPEHGVGS